MSRWLKEMQYLIEFLLLWPIVTVVRRLSEAQSKAFAKGLSRVLYRVLAHDRKWCLLNLRLVFGDGVKPSARTQLALRAFENLVLTRFEVIRWTQEWMAANVMVEGSEDAHHVCRDAASCGRGSILLTAHLGNFELLPAWGHQTGWKGTVMNRPQNNWRVERLLAGARTRFLQEVVPRSFHGLRLLLHNLRNGRGVALAVDQNAIGGVFVDFMGIPAASAPGAAWLALTTRAPVILAMSVRQPDGRHRLVYHAPFPLIETGDREQDVLANTQQYLRAIESYVRAYPEQYNWLHPRWRHRPDGSVWRLDTPFAAMAAERSVSFTSPAACAPRRQAA